MISEEALIELKKIYFDEFEIEISDEDAEKLGSDLLTMFDHIYRPIKKRMEG